MVRKERLELSRVSPLEPKSSAFTSSATFARGREGGGPCRDRTYDQLIKSQLLYQLSYRGMGCCGLAWWPMSLTNLKLARLVWVAKQKNS